MDPLFIIAMPGPTEWVIIAIVLLLLFGGRKIPELMRGLGKGIKEFKDASGEGQSKEDENTSSSSSSSVPGSKKN